LRTWRLPPSHSQAVLPKPETLALERIEKQDCEFRIFISTRQPALCPVCGQETKSRHSGYSRRLADLPWQGCSVQLWLSLHKWRCAKQNCPRKVFCERAPGVAPVYGRRTERLAAIVGAVGHVAGGLPGARLLERLAIQISDDTVRRQVVRNAHGMHAPEVIRCLGVDDWAWRKHQTYGTIFVDLDRHKVVDLLYDRAAESVAAWLKEHPTVEIVARDRSGLYADGAAAGAPDARQVADRFHLILNLSTAIERVLEERSRELIIPAATELTGAKPLPLTTPSKLTAQKEQQQQRRQRRLGRYEEVANCTGRATPRWPLAGSLPSASRQSGVGCELISFRSASLRGGDETRLLSLKPILTNVGKRAATTPQNYLPRSARVDTRDRARWLPCMSPRGVRQEIARRRPPYRSVWLPSMPLS